jgi:hypothetical protein
MNIKKRINAFSKLGESIISDKIELIKFNKNPWFTSDFIDFAVEELGKLLIKDKLEKWISSYPEIDSFHTSKRVGVITAGNIPFVGFHDFLSVLMAGHCFIGKLSSKDDALLPFIINRLIEIEPEFANSVLITDKLTDKIDAVIATGSNNTGRYFEYYFGKYPHIIRKNRSSVAVMSGNETSGQLSGLADDIFMYFGLGCRNVTKLFLPENYQLDVIFKASLKYKAIITHHKYANNYDYNRVIYLMNKINFKENGFFILKEDSGLASPISVVYYEYYKTIAELTQRLEFENEHIQCIVSDQQYVKNSVSFGESQRPELHDYADHIDTIKFLLKL